MGLLIFVVTDHGGTCGGVFSTLEKAMLSAQDHYLAPTILLPATPEGDPAVYGWAPCSWVPVAVGESEAPTLGTIEWRLINEAGERQVTITAEIIDAYVADWAKT